MRKVNLPTLFIDFPFEFFPTKLPDIPITGITLDSRRVGPGFMFVAMQGGSVDGHNFISKAIENGASAIVGRRDLVDFPIPYIRVSNPRRALSFLAAAYFDWPGRKLTVIGVTGTDGKTTTSNLIYEILRAAGISL